MRTEIELRQAYNLSLAEIKRFRLCSSVAKSFINRQIEINKEMICDLKAIEADAGIPPAGYSVVTERVEHGRFSASTYRQGEGITRRRLGTDA